MLGDCFLQRAEKGQLKSEAETSLTDNMCGETQLAGL